MWIFKDATNKNMSRFIGKTVDIFTPSRFADGHRVLYVTKPNDRTNWYFYTSTLVSMTRVDNYEDGVTTLTAQTHNSKYVFVKEL